MKKSKIIPVLCLLLTLSYCGNKGNGEIVAPGVVEGDIITLKSQAAGTLSAVHKNEGDTLEAGMVIAEIDKEKPENQLRELEIGLKELDINRQRLAIKSRLLKGNADYLKKQVQRFKRLRKNNSIPGEKLESMELKLLEANTALAELNKNRDALDVQEEKLENKMAYLQLLLKDHVIISPVQGVVSEIFVSRGENVFPNSSVADVLDTGSLYVEVFVEEQDLASLKLADPARILVDGMEEREFYGIISHFGSKAEFSPKYIISEKERKSLLYKVKVKLDKNLDVFKVGMPVTVVFKSSQPHKKND